MIPVGKYGTPAFDARVQATGQAHRETLHRARKRASALGFDDEMDMVRLNAELHEPRSEPLPGSPERGEHNPRERFVPEARQPLPELHRDVKRMSLLEFGTAHVRDA